MTYRETCKENATEGENRTEYFCVDAPMSMCMPDELQKGNLHYVKANTVRTEFYGGVASQKTGWAGRRNKDREGGREVGRERKKEVGG